MQLLLIAGPAGVGKSTLSWEMSSQLAAARVAHAGEDAEGMIVLPTDGKRPAELAAIDLQKIGWLNVGGQQKDHSP